MANRSFRYTNLETALDILGSSLLLSAQESLFVGAVPIRLRGFIRSIWESIDLVNLAQQLDAFPVSEAIDEAFTSLLFNPSTKLSDVGLVMLTLLIFQSESLAT